MLDDVDTCCSPAKVMDAADTPSGARPAAKMV
jgi:hypothetical protein